MKEILKFKIFVIDQLKEKAVIDQVNILLITLRSSRFMENGFS
jgi:hypothetical protein